MKKIVVAIILLISFSAYGQSPDFVRTKKVNDQNVVDARPKAYLSLNIPHFPTWTINGAKDSIAYVMYNTTLNKFGVYVGLGVWKEYATVEELKTAIDLKISSSSSVIHKGGSILVIGDSYAEPVYLTDNNNGYAQKLSNEIINAGNRGVDLGSGYYTQTNGIIKAFTQFNNGITTTGSFLGGGGNPTIELTAGQTVTITNRRFNYCDFFYAGSSSTGAVEVRLNGVLVTTKTLATTGTISSTYPTIVSEKLTSLTDVVTLTATGSTRIYGVQTLRKTNDAPFVYVNGISGRAFQDITVTAWLDVFGTYLNTNSGNSKTVICDIGINNMAANPPKALSPTAMVSQMAAFVTGINSRCGTVNYIFTIPARTNETTYPITTGFTYQDYITAITNFCTAGKHAVVRMDLTELGTFNAALNTGDGVHPNEAGHEILYQKHLQALGLVPLVNLASNDVTGILPIANGGTGSTTQNFVDLTAAQTNIAGAKTFISNLSVVGNLGTGGGTGLILNNTNTSGFTEIVYGPAAGGNFVFGYGGSNTSLSNQAYFFQRAANPILFATSNTERMRVHGSGNLGINNPTDAGFKLDVNGTGRFQNRLTLATGTTTIAPLNIPTGVLTTTAVSGNIENDGTNFSYTDNTATRRTMVNLVGAQTLQNKTFGAGNTWQGNIIAPAFLDLATRTYTAKTANYTVTSSDQVIHCTANTFTVTLPTAVGITGRVYTIKNTGAGTITIDANAAELIDASLTIPAIQNESFTLLSTGAGWIII